MSTPRCRAIDDLTDATSSRSPSISLVFVTSAVRAPRLASSRSAPPTSASRPSSRPCERLTSLRRPERLARLYCHEGQSPADQMYIYSPHNMRLIYVLIAASASGEPLTPRQPARRAFRSCAPAVS